MKTNKTQNNRLYKKLWLLCAVIAALLAFSPSLQGQVTIGDGAAPRNYSILEVVSKGNGGLRLPHLTTAQRDALRNEEGGSATAFASDANRTTPFLYEGLTIYNTTTRCIEYYNAHRWISMCEGTSRMEISPAPCNNIAADGTGCDSEFEVTDPDCLNGPFTFAIITGSDYASFPESDDAAGTFKIAFQPNNSTNPRSAVVRVTSSCTGLHKDFLFTQLGQGCDSSLGTAPSITSVPSGKNISFCTGGAVYLSVPANTANPDELIWTRNGIEVARGVNNITVTQAGVYDVWMGLIGCNQLANNAVTVTKSGTGAPGAVDIVVRQNNGLVCDANGTTKLVANTSSTGTVRWFKDGVLQSVTSPANEVNAGVGRWFAVVNDGTCWSTPSETVTVSVDPNAGSSLVLPVVSKSGSFCAGGSVQLAVTNAQAGYTYTWYENNTQLGTGIQYLYTVPSDQTSVVIRCRATMANSCASEAIWTESISTGTIPARPSITGDTQLCSGTATLNVVPAAAGTYTYAWYKDGQLIGTSQSINITSGGDYYASVTETGGCTSPLAHRTISTVSSAAPTATLAKSADSPNLDDVVTYMATINFGPATGYTWTITNATLQSGGGNSANAVVRFDQAGVNASVRVEVANSCGTGAATHTVNNVSPACVDPTEVFPSTDSQHSTIAGKELTLGRVSASFGGTGAVAAYQWYRNTTNSNTGGTLINGATSDSYLAKETTPGTYYYYCTVKNSSCNSATLSTGVYAVTVGQNPSTLPVGSGTFTGKTCFDVVETNFGGSCGEQAGRQAQKADFSQASTYTQTYTFTTSGSISKLRFIAVSQGEEIIDNVTYNTSLETATGLNGTYTVTVYYKQDLNAKASGLDRDNALKATIYAVYDNSSNGTGSDVMLKLDISVQDCICCPGYLAIGGEYTLKTTYLNHTTSAETFTQISPYFTATGNDICFYKTDGSGSNYIYWDTANTNCNNGNYVDAEHRPMGNWRLPSLAELGALQSIHSSLSSQPTAAPGTVNLRSLGYWSSTGYSGSDVWRWYFGSANRALKFGKTATTFYVRCVRTMD